MGLFAEGSGLGLILCADVAEVAERQRTAIADQMMRYVRSLPERPAPKMRLRPRLSLFQKVRLRKVGSVALVRGLSR